MSHVHSFNGDGKCTGCSKRRPGRPKKIRTADPAQVRATDERNATEQAAQVDSLPLTPPAPASGLQSERADRLRSLFAPPPPVVAAPATPPEPAPEPKPKTTTKPDVEDWAWVAGIATEGVDVGAGWGIGALSDRQPLEASESSRLRFRKKLEQFGEQRFGHCEVPTWLVLIICLVALILSKVIGAPLKSEIAAARAARAAKRPAVPTTAPAAPSATAPTAAPTAPDVATVAASPANALPFQPPAQQQIADDGSALDAPLGF